MAALASCCAWAPACAAARAAASAFSLAAASSRALLLRRRVRAPAPFLPRFGLGGGACGGDRLRLRRGLRPGPFLRLQVQLGNPAGQGEIEIEFVVGGVGRGLFGDQFYVTVGDQFRDGVAQHVLAEPALFRQFRCGGLAVHHQEHQSLRTRQPDGLVSDLEDAFGGLGVYREGLHKSGPLVMPVA